MSCPPRPVANSGKQACSRSVSRPLVPEVLVKDDQYAVVRPRIEVDELIAMDRQAPWL